MAKVKTEKGLFITLEGGEGAGKSTQIGRLAERLESAGYEVLTTREPGGTSQAEKIREIILAGFAEPLGAEFEATLFAAARIDHVQTLIAPALNAGKIVISDRFSDSTRVYQGHTGKVSSEFLQSLENLVKDMAWPDLTLVLDLAPDIGMARAQERRMNASPDRFEKENTELQLARQRAFLEIAKAEPDRCKVIDAKGNPEQIEQRIWNVVEPLLKKEGG